jgi:hypothetical protein
MKYKLIIIIFLFSSLSVIAQQKRISVGKKAKTLYDIIKGRWYAEDDKNVTLIFCGSKYIELYNKDTTDNLQYVLSYGCTLQNRIKTKTYNLIKGTMVYVVLYKDGKIEQCNELLTIDKSTISWMNSSNGKIFVYKRK